MADLEKIVDELSSLTLLEAAELKTLLEEKWGVTAAAPMAVAAMPVPSDGDGAAAEEQDEFDVVLTDVGPKKIQVIKAIRGLTDLGLKEAKDLVEAAPSTIIEATGKDAAAEAKKALEAEGATVELK